MESQDSLGSNYHMLEQLTEEEFVREKREREDGMHNMPTPCSFMYINIQ